MKTIKNKICSAILLIGGYLVLAIENDATVLVLSLLFAIPLILAKENLIS